MHPCWSNIFATVNYCIITFDGRLGYVFLTCDQKNQFVIFLRKFM